MPVAHRPAHSVGHRYQGNRRFGPEYRASVAATTMVGKDYLMLHQYENAEPALRDALATSIKTKPVEWQRYNQESLLGGALRGEKKYQEAEPFVISGDEGMKQRESKMPTPAKVVLREDGERAAQLYIAWGKPKRLPCGAKNGKPEQ